jgi:hypothetical protein
MKKCQYCKEPVEYSSSPTRGAWYGTNGRICPAGTEKFGQAIGHMPEWDLVTKQYR